MESNFKKPRNLRKRNYSSSEGSEEEEVSDDACLILAAKELQRQRQRSRGVNAEELAHGWTEKKKKDVCQENEQKGGYVDINVLKRATVDDDISQIGTSFAAETNKREEDTEMVKYVEAELARRKGIRKEEQNVKKIVNPEDILYELPENLKAISSSLKQTEDMLSNQMLSGIPEVDLGIQAKIRNIMQTEEAKQKLLQDRMNRRDAGVSFIPTNVAVNFVQHNRFNIEEDSGLRAKRYEPPKPKVQPARVGDFERLATVEQKEQSKKSGEKATDDFHFEKFKKQVRRY